MQGEPSKQVCGRKKREMKVVKGSQRLERVGGSVGRVKKSGNHTVVRNLALSGTLALRIQLAQTLVEPVPNA